MIEIVHDLLASHRAPLYVFFQRLHALGEPFITRSALTHEYARFLESDDGTLLIGTAFDRLMTHTQDVVAYDHVLHLAVRVKVGHWEFLQIHTEQMESRPTTVSEYLMARERQAVGPAQSDQPVLEIDLAPFGRGFPRLTEIRSIGRGVEFLNRFLSGRLFEADGDGLKRLLSFLRVHQVGGQQLMLGTGITTLEELRNGLRQAIDALRRATDGASWQAELAASGSSPDGAGRRSLRPR